MSSHVSCMWITCVSYVIACVLHAAYMRFTHYVTCIQIGTALLDFILVAPESQDMFINAGYPPCVTLAAAFFSSNPYSTPDPYIGSLEGCCRRILGFHTNLLPLSTSNCACLIQTKTGSRNENRTWLTPGRWNCVRSIVFVILTLGQKWSILVAINDRSLRLDRGQHLTGTHFL